VVEQTGARSDHDARYGPRQMDENPPEGCQGSHPSVHGAGHEREIDFHRGAERPASGGMCELVNENRREKAAAETHDAEQRAVDRKSNERRDQDERGVSSNRNGPQTE